MKIKLSKAQWKDIGNKAGWMKVSQQEPSSKEVCKNCHGNKLVFEKIRNPKGGSEYREHTSLCPTCNGKGYTTQEDRKKNNDSYLHSMGVGPCPHGNDCGCTDNSLRGRQNK